MTPYYEDQTCTIYLGDCLDILPRLERADLVLTDPPYNAGDIGKNHRRYENTKFPMDDADYRAFCQDWFAKASGLAERLVFSPGISHVGCYPPALWMIAWSKPGAVGFSRLQGFNVWEPILVYGQTPGKVVHDLYTLTPQNQRSGPERDHPCPKPLELWQWLMLQVSEENELIVDPFLGSGTTLRVAKNLGRRAIGIEAVERYCEIAALRLSQQVLF